MTYILAQMWENGAPSAREKSFGLPTGGKIVLSHVPKLKMLRFLSRIQIWVKNTNKIFDPVPDLHVGLWLLPHPSVTC